MRRKSDSMLRSWTSSTNTCVTPSRSGSPSSRRSRMPVVQKSSFVAEDTCPGAQGSRRHTVNAALCGRLGLWRKQRAHAGHEASTVPLRVAHLAFQTDGVPHRVADVLSALGGDALRHAHRADAARLMQ